MGRNYELLERLLSEFSFDQKSPGFFPCHTATTYLDGSKSCCTILGYLVAISSNPVLIIRERNHLNHTVLDTLIITILRSHTSMWPKDVDDSLRDEMRFPEKKSIFVAVGMRILNVIEIWSHAEFSLCLPLGSINFVTLRH